MQRLYDERDVAAGRNSVLNMLVRVGKGEQLERVTYPTGLVKVRLPEKARPDLRDGTRYGPEPTDPEIEVPATCWDAWRADGYFGEMPAASEVPWRTN